MLKPSLMSVLLLTGPTVSFAQNCLHGSNETGAERTRREQAIQFAHRLNAAERLAPRLDPQRTYRPLNELTNLPSVPAGFAVKLHTDGVSYTFSLKDTRDPCRFAVFSDQESDVYAANPEPGQATIVPLGTK